MAKLRLTRQQKMTAVREMEQGVPPAAVAVKYGVSTHTVHRWRAAFTVEERDVQERLRLLEVENRRLKSKFAELTLDYTSLRAALINEFRGDC